MKRPYCIIVRACSWLTGHTGASIVGVAVVWMASAPRPAFGQSAWPSYPNNTVIKITTDGKVGIGTSTPLAKLDVVPAASSVGIRAVASGDANSIIVGNNSGAWAPLVVQNPSGWGIYDQAAKHYFAGNVGIGTTNPQYKLAVNGTVGAKEVIVTNTGWPDYVFRPGYRLRPLSDVGAYIRAHHHLPDIPSEAEVKEKGVSLGDMQAKLLAKIEELTLYMIQQDRENRELREHMTQQEKRNEELSERLAQLETRTAGAPSGPGALTTGRSR